MKVGIVGNMTKLEEKLQELGYKNSVFQNRYIKYYEETDNYILIKLSNCKDEIKSYLYWQSAFYEQEHIETLQQAFNEMQKDLEILKECEEECGKKINC